MLYLNLLVQLTEKDKRIIIALLIVFIIVFVLVAYIGNAIKALMRRYGKGIDGYMHELCTEGLVKKPSEFYAQVYKKETRRLYFSTKWVLRAFIVVFALFMIYAAAFKPSGAGQPLFLFARESLKDLKIVFDTPRGNFFGFTNFPVGWPRIVEGPKPKWNLGSISTYIMMITTVVSVFGVTNATLKFMARLARARKKGKEVFSKSLDDANFA